MPAPATPEGNPSHGMQGTLHVTTQNLLSLTLSDAQLMAIDNLLADLEKQLSGLASMDAEKRKSLARMGDKSEAFCRQALNVLEQNPQIVPPSLGLAEAQADLAAIDALRPRLQRLRQLTERAEDTEMALGSDIVTTALEGYALLKVSGKGESLKAARRELSARFARQKAPEAEPVA